MGLGFSLKYGLVKDLEFKSWGKISGLRAMVIWRYFL